MARLALAVLSLGIWGSAQAQIAPEQAIKRVSEEAAVFQENLPRAITQETLTQHAQLPPSRLVTFGPKGTSPLPSCV